MAPISIAVDIRRTSNRTRSDWFGTALRNSGFMHSLLCTAALHLYCLGECSMETILDHKAKAIEAVNAALQHPDSRIGLSDANIGTVFNLLTIDEGLLSPYVRNINKEEFEDQLIKREVHLTGLRNMVQMRGGLVALSSNRILQAFILWCVPDDISRTDHTGLAGAYRASGTQQHTPSLPSMLPTSPTSTTLARALSLPTLQAINQGSPAT